MGGDTVFSLSVHTSHTGGYPRPGMGYPQPPSTPVQIRSQVRTGGGTSNWNCIACPYTAGGMPLAFTQEDFLVVTLNFVCRNGCLFTKKTTQFFIRKIMNRIRWETCPHIHSYSLHHITSHCIVLYRHCAGSFVDYLDKQWIPQWTMRQDQRDLWASLSSLLVPDCGLWCQYGLLQPGLYWCSVMNPTEDMVVDFKMW